MLRIRKANFVQYDENGGVKTPLYVAQLDCDTISDIPAVNGIEGMILGQGTSALIITEGRLAILAGNGHWYCGAEVIV